MAKRRDRLIERRIAKGDRDYVAHELGISKVYLRMIETGALKPGRDLMLRIASYFGESLEILFPDMFSDNQAI